MQISEIMSLSTAEKILLIEKIWDSIDSDQLSLSEEQKSELDRRIIRARKGDTEYFTWEQVKKGLSK